MGISCLFWVLALTRKEENIKQCGRWGVTVAEVLLLASWHLGCQLHPLGLFVSLALGQEYVIQPLFMYWDCAAKCSFTSLVCQRNPEPRKEGTSTPPVATAESGNHLASVQHVHSSLTALLNPVQTSLSGLRRDSAK